MTKSELDATRGGLYGVNQRTGFLLLLALGMTALLLWLIQGWLIAVFLAAVLAALAHPLYHRLLGLLRGRKLLASGVTVLLSLFLVVIPLLLFLGVLVAEAIEISERAGAWLATSGSLEEELAADPHLRQLLPYEKQITTKAGELAEKAGAWVAGGLAAGARGTATFLLELFVMLYAMLFFLMDGAAILDAVLRFTPLSRTDKERLLRIFASVGRATLKGTLIIGIVQGGLAAISFWVAGIPGAIFWFAIMTVLSIIPGVGTALVWIPAVIYLALVGKVGAALGVALWCALVVGTLDNVLRPVLIGKDTEMPDLLIMLTTLGGLALFGPAGLVIGPIIGALFLTVWQLWGSAIGEAQAV